MGLDRHRPYTSNIVHTPGSRLQRTTSVNFLSTENYRIVNESRG